MCMIGKEMVIEKILGMRIEEVQMRTETCIKNNTKTHNQEALRNILYLLCAFDCLNDCGCLQTW